MCTFRCVTFEIFVLLKESSTTISYNKVRDWVSILPQSVSLWNAYRDRKPKRNEEVMKVPQSFTFMAREGQTETQEIAFEKTLA